ncbi:MAG TPA: alpha/beta hydrolase [Planctomycetaceae bacterium]|nr:alpha/beta hydrolase [Planctomycetaceae bacterium]
MTTVPLILIPGLAADESIFAPQKSVFPNLTVPRWPAPAAGDTLSSYAERFARAIRSDEPCVLGGASFGGMVALEMARYVHPLAVLLIGSVREPAELPRRVRLFRPLRAGIGLFPFRLLQWSSMPAATASARRLMPHLGGLARQFGDAETPLLRWSIRQILSWDERPRVECPVFHIHGDRDHVVPIGRTRPDTIVGGGGHVLSLTHPEQVNAFIRSCLERIEVDRG